MTVAMEKLMFKSKQHQNKQFVRNNEQVSITTCGWQHWSFQQIPIRKTVPFTLCM